MGLLKTSGIVIKQVNFSEADKILTILTRDHGKIQALAKGARKTKNPFLASTQLFCYSDFIFYQGKSMIYVNQAELRESFYDLRTNLENLTYASYILELINIATQEHQREEKFFLLLVHTLKHITYSKKMDINLIILAFQGKLIALSGYAPHLENCVSCGHSLNEKIKISSKMGGLLCPKCFHFDPYAMGINQEGRRVLFFVLHEPLSKLIQLETPKGIIKRLIKVMNTYISNYFEKVFYSLNFLNTIENKGDKNRNIMEGDGKNGGDS